jgi:hypothetical protein
MWSFTQTELRRFGHITKRSCGDMVIKRITEHNDSTDVGARLIIPSWCIRVPTRGLDPSIRRRSRGCSHEPLNPKSYTLNP